MFNPVVIPLPIALALVVAFAATLYAADRFLRADTWNPWAGQSWASPAPTGRHRPENIPEADRRDWAYIVAMRMSESVQRQHRVHIAASGLLEIELAARIEETREQDDNSMWSWSDPLEIAGLPDRYPAEPAPLHIPADVADWRQPLTEFERTAGVLEIEAGQLVEDTHPAPCGFPDLMPCICATATEDTRELETVQ